MTDDPELDELLRRYRPAGPPPALRARVLSAAAGKGRVWPWAAAAAALLVGSCALQFSTRSIYHGVAQSLTVQDGVSLEELPALSQAIGDDQLLRERFETALRLERSGDRGPSAEAPQSW